MVGGEHQRVDVAAMIGEAPYADVQPAGNTLDHVNDTRQSWVWMQSTYAPPANAKTHYDHLVRLNGLITPKTRNLDRFNQRVADDLFTLAKAAHAVELKDLHNGYKPSRDEYVEAITTSANTNFKLKNTAPLLKILFHPVEPFARQVEKAFLLAIRVLYLSINACKAIARPNILHAAKQSPAFSGLI